MSETAQTKNKASDETHTSVMLHELIRKAPDGTFTLEWLIGSLPSRSFGVIFLFLAAVAILPVISIPARILILVLALEVIIGYRTPILPQRWMQKPLPSRYLAQLEKRVIPWLEKLETCVRPRWHMVFLAIRRIAAAVVFVMTLVSLLAPFPLANVPPALICIMMALSYLEHDGLLFMVAFVAAVAFLAGIAVFAVLAV